MYIRGPLHDIETSNNLDMEAFELHCSLARQGKRSHAAELASYRLEGPLLPVLLPPGTKESAHSLLGFGRNH